MKSAILETQLLAKRILVTGVVQGVGFRPFVYGLAKQLGLKGWVCNTSAGVEIILEGAPAKTQSFLEALRNELPPLAQIDTLSISTRPVEGFASFEIRASEAIAGAFQPVSADMSICADCTRELFDPADKRYLYPFINCTNCGPRFTIIKDLPYDRPETTMAIFPMCPECHAEYSNPLDRRFHAQPTACADCGPHTWLLPTGRSIFSVRLTAILEARRLLRQGKILAIKGLGGFHLACDATNPSAVEDLRRRKGRAGKPFALMTASLEQAESLCHISADERALLTSRQKPIVILKKRSFAFEIEGVAPALDSVGIMLPYTPLHLMLLDQNDTTLSAEPVPPVLVMTSGNFNEEPIATDNLDALTRLDALADAFLLHNRDIHTRCDDSVLRVDNSANAPVYLRRSRGYAPYPVHLPFESGHILALGGELKNAFCLSLGRYAFLSQHIGDMENVETFKSYEHSLEHLSRLFRVKPELVAHDLHPNYFTTSYAQNLPNNTQRLGVQHHHAHIASCMADNGLENIPVIGLAFDGTGYGTDGKIWGGEALITSYTDFKRVAHLEYLPLPGGETAIRNPWRIALGYAHTLGLEVDELPFLQKLTKKEIEIVKAQTERGLNAPLTSSIGRLFDAAASLAGVRNSVNYEAQAAIELEVLSQNHMDEATSYPFQIQEKEGLLIIKLSNLLAALISDASAQVEPGKIGARFHKTVALISSQVCIHLRKESGINQVALSGGVWQNQLLLTQTRQLLRAENFEVFTHTQTPANDGGLALGQAAIAAHFLASQKAG